MPLGIYISVPFCRSKCTFCNFASDVAPAQLAGAAGGRSAVASVYDRYSERLCADILETRRTVQAMGGLWEDTVDSLYLGGGTPTLLGPERLKRIFAALRQQFDILPGSEVTVECAPGTLSSSTLDGLLECGMNRASLGVQSFVQAEARAVGRPEAPAAAGEDTTRLRAAGIANFNLDLIAGLPHQTMESWQCSLDRVIALAAPHVSVYMLEIDQDSRLGREILASGARYHAASVPDEELTAALYGEACVCLPAAGISQYEISNFARPGAESTHNLKYWTRRPYLGFGLDAHSFLPAANGEEAMEAVRWATTDSLEPYLAGAPPARTAVSRAAAREECFFLGLRLNRGVELRAVERQYGDTPKLRQTVSELQELKLLDYDREYERIRLTPQGRLLANEVFQRFLEG